MKNLSIGPLLLLGLLLTLGPLGCNSPFGGDDGGSAQIAENAELSDESIYEDLALPLEDEFGGYDTEDESPFFGDPRFAAMFAEDEPVGDIVAGDPAVVEMEAEPGARVHYVKLLWGQLRPNHLIDFTTDWGGNIGVDRGAIVVLRQIRFEHRTDWVVRPRTDRRLVELYSVTRPHHDGLLLKIIDPEPESDALNRLHIALGPADHSIAVAELDGYREVLPIDDARNVLFVQSPELLDCPNGFIRGIWIHRTQEPRGVFLGAFTDYEGRIRGYVRGHWGITAEGDQRFRGKMITRDGSFRGILKGKWQDDPRDENSGEFEGIWVDRFGEAKGELGGHYRRGLRRGGFFGGRWIELCE